MPTEAVDTGLSDQELFDGANADEAPADEAAVEAPEAEPEQEGQPRDEAGRFAALPQIEQLAEVAAEIKAGAEKPAVDDNAAMVPSWRVREINEEKRALAEKVAAFEAERRQWQQRPAPQPAPVAQEKAEPPDPLLDPVGYREFIRNELREERLNERREESLAKAHEDHGKEFEEAYAAAQQAVDPALKARMQQSRDPGKTLIQWHRERKTMAEVGTDPNAFFEKRFEAYLSDPANQAKVLERIRGGTQTQPGAVRQAAPVNLPPSLTRATNASANISADDDDISNDGLWRHANG
jgi:hypothetical protein